MSDPDDLYLKAPSRRDRAVPPSRWAVPARFYQGGNVGDLATARIPGTRRGWLIDELVLADPTPITRSDARSRADTYVHEADGAADAAEGYLLFPHAEVVAAERRGEQRRDGLVRVLPRWVSCDDLVIYRDAAERVLVEDLPAAPSWLERMLAASRHDGPPEVLRPRPASELPSLSGRRLRTLDERDGWRWVVALSEAYDDEGDIVAEVTDLYGGWVRLCYGAPDVEITRAPAHALWTY